MREISGTTLQALLRAHGDFAIAYSVAFQPELQHFGDERGFLSFKMVGRTAFVLADPIAPLDRWERLVLAFVAAKRDVTFWQASHGLAEILARHGFLVNAFGSVTSIDLPSFTFSGPHRRNFRIAEKRMAANGYTVREIPVRDLDAGALRAVSEGWRRTRVNSRRELKFLARPLVLDDEPGVRKFFLLDASGQPKGLAFFDPIYRDGEIVGYLSNTRRWLPDAGPFASYAMVRKAIETFKSEGIARFHLGIMPLHAIEDTEFSHSWLARRAFRLIYTSNIANSVIYPLRGLAEHKASFDGSFEQVYCALNTFPVLPRLLKLIVACGIL